MQECSGLKHTRAFMASHKLHLDLHGKNILDTRANSRQVAACICLRAACLKRERRSLECKTRTDPAEEGASLVSRVVGNFLVHLLESELHKKCNLFLYIMRRSVIFHLDLAE
jgi:hypothetical protein